MKKALILICLMFLSIFSVSSFAQNKVAVIPLFGSESSLQHYRLAQQIGSASQFCTTPSFYTPGYDTQAVITSNVSIQPTVDDTDWWSGIQFSTDGGSTWEFLSSQVTVSGAIADTSANTSEKSFLNLVPNSSYMFRIILADEPTHDSGQCEIFITFNGKAASDVVTTLVPSTRSSAEEPAGPGTLKTE